MKTEKMLEMMYKVVNYMTSDERQEVDNYMETIGRKLTTDKFNDAAYMVTVPAIVGEIIRVLKTEVEKEEERKIGKNNQVAVIKSVLKTREKYKPFLPNVTFVFDDKQIVIDGFRLFVFNDICKSVPIGGTEEIERENPKKYLKLIPNKDGYKELILPDKSKLSAYIKCKKAELKSKYVKNICSSDIIYDFGKGMPMVSAEYLLDAIKGITDCKMYYIAEDKPVLIEGKNGVSVLMPIKKEENNKWWQNLIERKKTK